LFSLDVSDRTVKRIVIWCAAAGLLACSRAGAKEPAELRALEAKAICVAFAAFQASAPKADLRHFSVLVHTEGKNYDVVFLPDPGPGEEFLAGGETKYGAEVHYIISRRTFAVVRKEFAK